MNRYLEYLDEYCTHFDLWKHIEINTRVTKLRRKGPGDVITFRKQAQGRGETQEEHWECDAVLICTGLHVEQHMPRVAGIEHVPVVTHSSKFKGRSDFGEDKNIVVLGSRSVIAEDSSAVRRYVWPLWSSPLVLTASYRVPNPVLFSVIQPATYRIPTDVSTASLFESMYVHPIMRRPGIPWAYYNTFVKSTLWLVGGSKYGIDQWTRIPDTNGRTIDLAPWPDHIDKDGIIHFVDNGRPEAKRMSRIKRKVDMMIMATGYTQTFPFLDATYPRPEDADIRRI
ncbi:uncharacterized protein A1O9_12632 [Exophiala aquamarina CBS 119918]|uniref:Uncharacterized protein n=1 Tax=Exophiala aquamarina CBS 119918 TaxID=1182545 RepID=A0A072NV85_9EURO|nr:uncharacterized protein A1O9_12632 [Exophiala aquamarina CBS 119918]KEF51282.1 hypothetical protein A1O9_12632 [Exophiala aquamarina CBS 119918]